VRTIRETVDVGCPFSAAADFATRYLETRAQSGLSTILVPLAPAPFSLWTQKRVEVTVRTGLDSTDPARRHEALWVDFEPQGPFPFPRFHTRVTFRPYNTRTRVSLEGVYQPPLGLAGRVVDALVGGNVARRAMRALLEQIRKSLESQWEDERLKFGSIARQ
jgi:hypothetical protein